jgi:hypothetical protein
LDSRASQKIGEGILRPRLTKILASNEQVKQASELMPIYGHRTKQETNCPLNANFLAGRLLDLIQTGP